MKYININVNKFQLITAEELILLGVPENKTDELTLTFVNLSFKLSIEGVTLSESMHLYDTMEREKGQMGLQYFFGSVSAKGIRKPNEKSHEPEFNGFNLNDGNKVSKGVTESPKLLTSGKWNAGDFAEGKLDIHYNKHVIKKGEWAQNGNLTKEAYLNRSRKLMNSEVGGKIEGFTSKEG